MVLKKYIGKCFLMALMLVAGATYFSSCGKSDASSPNGLNVRLQVINLSPDAYPVKLIVNNNQIGATYRYDATPSYFFLGETNFPLQIRSTRVADSVLSRDTVAFQPNRRYTVFLTGLYSDGSIKSLITMDDTVALAPVGKGGKIRFVNGALRNTSNFDVWINGVVGINNVSARAVSKYITLPAGNYNVRLFNTGTATNSLAATDIVIQDGRLYTLYSQGIAGRTDSAALTLKLLNNNTAID